MTKINDESETMEESADADLVRSRGVLRSMADGMNEFREISVTMPVGEVIMFLHVALNEGASLTELTEKLDMKKSTASRYLLDLSSKTRTGVEGHGLVIREQDPAELRRNMYTLSPKGRTLIRNLVNRQLKFATKGGNESHANLS
jgi:DNA-binding MarR family transcriptional regulator